MATLTVNNYQCAKLPDADFRNAVLRGSTFSGAYLHKADFRNADLRGVDFTDADLRCADFSGANLTEAKLLGADVEGAIFENVIGFEPIGVEVEYEVKLTATIRSYATVKVRAKSEDEAKRLVMQVADVASWDSWGDPEDVEVDNIRIA